MSDGDDDLSTVRERKKRALMADHGLGAPPSPVYVDGSRNFEKTVAAHDVVVVHYYASGGAGQRLHPIVESVARETFAAVAKVNVVHHQKLALERNVEGTPTFDVFVDGEREERIEGAVEKEELVELVEEYADV
ncbi:thioredoxin family protein [Halorussus salilacus]|uniref:thioredoxin family protein n=1 Tax=Halorussus salilacus TaxID=2953750 RepID=UPI00209F18A5|nr:thioredoxin family protein [Halorussus salilacus]USZ68358.1 thioredoxin family protein [Halorussus salilacus]